MNYLYALTYVDFDHENKDVIYFSNESEKDSYFNLSSLFDSTNKNEINFEKGNLLDVSFTINLDETNEIDKEFNFNYLIIKEVKTEKYYFYFASRPRYDNLGRMRVGCHLDIFTTYFNKINVQGIINRATLREFMKDPDSTDIIYNTGSESHVFSVDDTYQGKKFLQNDKVLQPHVFTYLNNAQLDQWLEEYVECWQYLYVDCNHQYKYDNTPYRHTDQFLSNGIATSFSVLAMPIYKEANKYIYVKWRDISDPNNPHTYNIRMDESSIEYFRQANDDNSYVYSSKLSKQPPFTPITSSLDTMNFLCSISTSGNLVLDFGDVSSNDLSPLVQLNTRVFVTHSQDTYNYFGLFEVSYQMKRYYNCNVSSFIQSYIKTRMTKSYYLDTLNKDFWKYPNATSLKNIELKITYNGQEYSTTPSKIDTGEASIEMLEALSPDLSKTYVRWNYTGYYAFRSYNSKTLTGGIFNDDTSISLGTSKLAETLAQSKNFFMQRQVNIGANALLGLGSSVAKMDVLGVAKGMAKESLDEINYGFEVDNIENAPSHLQRASGNGLFNLLTKDYGLHLEIWMMTQEDLTNIAQYYNRFGVQTTTYGDKYDIVQKHKYFDYVEMDVQYIFSLITGFNLPVEVREEFKRKLKRGVRFWYSDLYNYNKYNYERSLE